MSEEYTLRIAPDGVDARSADAKELSLVTDYPSLKVKSRQKPKHFDTIPYTFPSDPPVGNTNLVVIEHNLGYKPPTLGQFSQDGETYQIMPFVYEIGGSELKQFRCTADDRYLYLFLRRQGASGINLNGVTVYLKYSIYVDGLD